MRCPACDTDNLPGADSCEHCGLDLAGLDVIAWCVDPHDPLLVKPLRELPLKEPLFVAHDHTVAHVVELMTRHHEGCVFVTAEAGATIGVLTEHDLAARVAAPGRDPGRTCVAEVMTRDPVALRAEDPLAWALHRMGVDGHRHVPVFDGERLMGVLSSRVVLELLRGA